MSEAIGTEERRRANLTLVGSEPPLIAADEEPPVEIVNPDGGGDVVLICEHAGNLVPRSLDSLGVSRDVLESHVAWDPGAAEVARLMAEMLDSPLILQRYSRLVYDCNRPPEAESAMPVRSEIFDIPGNAGLSDAARRARTDAIYRPFRAGVASVLDQAAALGKTPAVVTVHSFTPVFHGKRRTVELGLLYDRDTALADAMLDVSATWPDLDVRRNEPYGPADGVTHTLEVDAIARGLANVMIEIRNDLIIEPRQQSAMATRLSALVTKGMRRLTSNEPLGSLGVSG
ncbi:MAG: N-formylglutamate amidohydrolase [Pseudomonadota bacterium]